MTFSTPAMDRGPTGCFGAGSDIAIAFNVILDAYI